MCAITGIVLTDHNQSIDRALLAAMTSSLAHRGPDGEGYYVNGRVGLGNRRLAIIDVAGGDQPIYNEDRTIVVVFNGEIYNYRELRDELLARGHTFRTVSDTEVIVHLYEERGDACVEALNGMFAFALWDQRNQRLLLARDRMGEKPLYYTHQGGRLLFASELKALRQDRKLHFSLSLPAVDDYLAYGYVPAPRTIFENVLKLPPGHILVWEHGRVSVRAYWRLGQASEVKLGEQDAVEHLRHLLLDATRLRLRSDVPVGALLSGGLDSSTIVALAGFASSSPVETFSVGFEDRDFDELDCAQLVANHLGTKHHEIIVRETDLSVFPDLVAHFDEPFADPSAIPTYYVSREARRFVKVCLSGDAGDELFGGYSQYLDTSLDRLVAKIPASLRRHGLGALAGRLPDHTRGKGWMRRLEVSGPVRYQRHIGVFDAHERRALFQPDLASYVDPGAWLLAPSFADTSLDAVSIRMRADQRTYLPDDILVKVDRTSMKCGLELRVPFLDHRVVEYANALPLHLKIRGRTTKYVLRQAVSDLLPGRILSRPKKGFAMPLKPWLRDTIRTFATELLLAPDARTGFLLRPQAMAALLDAHQRGVRDFSERIWALLWLEQWCRANNI